MNLSKSYFADINFFEVKDALAENYKCNFVKYVEGIICFICKKIDADDNIITNIYCIDEEVEVEPEVIPIAQAKFTFR